MLRFTFGVATGIYLEQTYQLPNLERTVKLAFKDLMKDIAKLDKKDKDDK